MVILSGSASHYGPNELCQQKKILWKERGMELDFGLCGYRANSGPGLRAAGEDLADGIPGVTEGSITLAGIGEFQACLR